MRWLLLCGLIVGCTGSTPGVRENLQTIPLAVTIDDLPFVGPVAAGQTRDSAIRAIVTTLAERRVPATGFVVCGRTDKNLERLTIWRRSGVELGNHSTSHRSLDVVGADAWLADVTDCQTRLTDRLGAAPRWFRYPFLQTGAEPELRAAASDGLRRAGLRRAPVSVDTADWVFAKPYAEATKTDRTRARRIARAYREHILRAWRHYRRVAVERTGREIPQVLLLHANAILADELPRVLDMLAADGARFVDMESALSDPVYTEGRDDWIDPVGASWLYRLAPADKTAWGWDRGQQRTIEARFLGRSEAEPIRIGRDTSVRRIKDSPAWVVRHDRPVAANALVYRTAEGIPVLVDTPWTAEATRDVLDWAATRFGRPIAVAIVGHYHADSAGGIGALRAAGIDSVGSVLTARLIVDKGAALQRTMVKQFGPAFEGPVPQPPTRVIEALAEVGATHSLTVGGSEIRVVFPGPAHAPDNVVTYFAESRVLFGGCMVKGGNSLGFLGDADLASWPQAIDRLKALGAKVVVPGHGDRMDADQLENTQRLLREKNAGGRPIGK